MMKARFAVPLAAALIACAGNAAADEFPKMRAGLWEILTTVTPGSGAPNPPFLTTMCLDDSVQKDMMRASQGVLKGLCTRDDVHIAGNTVTVDTVCNIGGSRVTSHSVMRFTGDTHYHTEAHATYEPALSGQTSASTLADGRYARACPAGMKPGDMRLPDGRIVNFHSLNTTQ
jgi:Protein of unknown function (DUF3617)